MNSARNVFGTYQTTPLTKILLRTYAFKSDLKIKWLRPEKISCIDPRTSGDLQSMSNINKKDFILEFRDSRELKTADPNVQKLFSLEYNPKKFTNRAYFYEIMDKVKRHEYDTGSVEVKLARWTGVIRALQEVMQRFPRDKRIKVNLKELIERRKKHLKYLRRWDYRKFEWLLETLDIVYKPSPSICYSVSRKDSLCKLTDKYCENLKQDRLNKLKLQFESQQPAFLSEKIHLLQFIRDEQKECNVEVTVTQEEIDGVKKQLEDLKKHEQKNEEL